jgi:hypothetical protein
MARSSCLAALALLAFASPAVAGSVSVVQDGQVRFEAFPGEDNVVRLARPENQLEVSDRAGNLRAEKGCERVLPRRAVCDGYLPTVLCGDGTDRVEDPWRDTFVDASCERVRTYGEGTSVRDSLTVLAHPVAVGPASATFRIRWPLRSINDFGEYSPCDGVVFVGQDDRMLGRRGYSHGANGRTFLVRVPLHGLLAGAVDVGIEAHTPDGEPDIHARWVIALLA